MSVRNISIQLAAILLIVATGIASGCSAGGQISPDLAVSPKISGTDNPHQLWGLWTIYVDANAGTIQAVPQRQTELRLNVLPFLEPPPFEYLAIDFGDLQIIPPTGGQDGRILVDVLLTHPFVGLTQFTGFDVKGIVFGPGIDNADGTTRWWNPVEFYGEGIFGFQPGVLGNPDIGLFPEILNDYKYYCMGLGENDDLATPTVTANVIAQRGHFHPGATLSRHYELNFGPEVADFFIFQYAVDASWVHPVGDPPWGLGSFTLDANQPEAWLLSVAEIENSLEYYGGVGSGDLTIYVGVHDWHGFEHTRVTLSCEEEGVFDPVTTLDPIFEEDVFALYELAVTDATPSHTGDLPLAVEAAVSNFTYQYAGGADSNPPDTVASYTNFTVNVEEGSSPSECEGALHAAQGWVTNLYLDYSSFETTWDISVIQMGTLEGMCIFPFSPSYSQPLQSLNWFDPDSPVEYPDRGVFHTFAPEDQCNMIYSIDCDPASGYVVYVGGDKPDRFRVINSDGTWMSEVPINSTTQTIAIQAMCYGKEAQLWVLSLRQTMIEPYYELRCFSPIYGPPYYGELKFLSLGSQNPFSLMSVIYDMDYMYQTDRLYIFDRRGNASEKGSIHVFDIDSNGDPSYNPTLTKKDIFPTPAGPFTITREYYYYHVAWGGDIVIDHESGDNEHCRITAMAVLDDDGTDQETDTYWMLFDEDLNLVDDYHEPFSISQGGKCWNTFTVNPDTNRNVIAMWRPYTYEYAEKPTDW